MRKFTGNLLAVSLLCLVSAGAAFAHGGNSVKEHVTFPQDVMVNDTLVKQGSYLVKYDPLSSVVRIMDGKKVVAQASADLIFNEKKSPHDVLYFSSNSGAERLTAMKLGGQRAEIKISDHVASKAETSEFRIGEVEVDLSNLAATDAVVPDTSAADMEAPVPDTTDVEASDLKANDALDTTPSADIQPGDSQSEVDCPDVDPIDED